MKKTGSFGKAMMNAVLFIMSLLMLFPFFWMLLGAFKPASELQRAVPSFLPEAPTLDNFRQLIFDYGFGKFFINSLGVTLVSVAVILFTSSLLGFIFAKIQFPGSQFFFILILASMMVPLETKIVPMFLTASDFHLLDSYTVLILPFVVDAFGIYLFREFIITIPNDYLDAARIDGANEWKIYANVILPLTKPVFSALAIFSFVFMWDQLMWPLVVTFSDAMKTFPLGMVLLSNQRGAIYNLVFAASFISVIPTIIFFLIFQKQIVKGVVLAGVKG